MHNNRVSLSKSALLLSPCIAWAGPKAKWYDEAVVDSDDMSKRDKGILFHKLIDRNSSECGPVPPPDVMVWLQHANRYLDQVLGPRCDTIQSEIAVGIDWESGHAESFPGVKDRNYPTNCIGWQFGTADLVCVLKTGELLIADWKTGGNEGAKEQLLSLACGFQVCMTDADGLPRPVRTLCLQVNDEGVWPHETAYTDEELQAHWDSMRFRWEDVGKRNVSAPGIHCTQLYCPHLAYCKGIAEVTTVAAGTDGGALATGGDPMSSFQPKDTPDSDREAGATMSLISAARRQQKYQEAQLKKYIASGGRVLAGEYEWSGGANGFRWRKAGI